MNFVALFFISMLPSTVLFWGFPDLPHIQRGYTNQSVTKKEQRWQNKDNGKHTYHRASCHQHTHCADDVDIGVKCDTKGRSKQAHAGYNDGRNGRGKRRPHGLFSSARQRLARLYSGWSSGLRNPRSRQAGWC